MSLICLFDCRWELHVFGLTIAYLIVKYKVGFDLFIYTWIFVWVRQCFISSELSTNAQLQTILLKTILKVATTYRTVLMANAFPSSLKNPLLQLSVVNKPTTRIIVQQILHTLIDRHDNIEKFSKIWYVHHNQAIRLFQSNNQQKVATQDVLSYVLNLS